ncbi:hypothetical protein [Anaeromicropila herbilytica]|uniref:LXG domain-containing protein n=1 Tax=Anaeromicropila herbilytica TaxID=2785025 RepID=A0A7R7EHZ5_9FIRM|nr:hypothetical protein [Anaeromicropila herbilytica]BCN29083.1 hypothetical protein bsdtb5_03780 [Anaeromicropila herbilytica]
MLDLEVRIDILKGKVDEIIKYTEELELMRDRVYHVMREVEGTTLGNSVSNQLDHIIEEIIHESITMKQYYSVLESAIQSYERTENKIVEKYVQSKTDEKEHKKEHKKKKKEKSAWDHVGDFFVGVRNGAGDLANKAVDKGKDAIDFAAGTVGEAVSQVASVKDVVVNLDDIALADLTSFLDNPEEYKRKTKNQVEKGNFTDDVTLLGTGISMMASAFGVDAPMDARDLAADVKNFDGSKKKAGTILVDSLAFLPLAGVFKNADELTSLSKKAVKVKRGVKVTKAVKGAKKGEKVASEVAVNKTGNNLTDYYVGPNGKALPSQYKDWIGTNIQEELLNQAENPQLKNAIKQLYRGKSFIGDGGTADVIKFEQETGIMLGKNGGSHVQKGIDLASYIENKILTQNLSETDKALATKLLNDLKNALGR